jgi:hypothetical protein
LPAMLSSGCLVNSIFMHRGAPGEHESSVTNFMQEVLKGQLPLSARELCGQRVEVFGRREALVALLDHQLPFLEHVHELDTDECGLTASSDLNPNMGRVTRFTAR